MFDEMSVVQLFIHRHGVNNHMKNLNAKTVGRKIGCTSCREVKNYSGKISCRAVAWLELLARPEKVTERGLVATVGSPSPFYLNKLII